jgi:AraC-like DNA-binding protein
VKVLGFSGEELEQIARGSFMPVLAQTHPNSRGRLESQDLGTGSVLLHASFGGAMHTLRTDRMAARTSGSDLMVFCVHMAGRGHVRQHERVAELSAGSGVLYEARSQWELVSPAESQSLALQFSRELLPLRAAEITAGCARSLDSRSPGFQMLSSYLRQLRALAGSLTAEQRLDAGHAAINLLVMALRDSMPAVIGDPGSSTVVVGMLRSHVRAHLADPHLSVAELARRHHMSVRQVYALFQRIGTTPGDYIRQERMLAAQRMLSDSRQERLAVSAISAAVGVPDVRTFERAFRRQYGTTPAAWRRERSRAGDDSRSAS